MSPHQPPHMKTNHAFKIIITLCAMAISASSFKCDFSDYNKGPVYMQDYFRPLSYSVECTDPHPIIITTSNITSLKLIAHVVSQLIQHVLHYRTVEIKVQPLSNISSLSIGKESEADIMLEYIGIPYIERLERELIKYRLMGPTKELDRGDQKHYFVGPLGVFNGLSINVPIWLETLTSLELKCSSNDDVSHVDPALLSLFNNSLLQHKLDMVLKRTQPKILLKSKMQNGAKVRIIGPQLKSDMNVSKIVVEEKYDPIVWDAYNRAVMYKPQHCTPSTCLIIVTSHFYTDLNNTCLTKLIDGAIIYSISITELSRLVVELEAQREPVLFVASGLDDLTASGKFKPVSISRRIPCSPDLNCDLGPLPLVKVADYNLTLSAPKIYHMLQNVTFSNKELLSLARRVDHSNYDSSVQEVVCGWLKNGSWQSWVERSEAKVSVPVGMFLSPELSQLMAVVIQVAIEYINNHTSILPSHTLQLFAYQHKEINKTYRLTPMIQTFLDWVSNVPLAVSIGVVEGSYYYLPKVASMFPSPFFAIGSTEELFYRTNNHTYISMRPEYTESFLALARLFEEFTWSKVSCVVDHRHEVLLEVLKIELRKFQIKVVIEADIDVEDDDEVVQKELMLIRNHRSNIVIFMVEDYLLPKILCALDTLDMTPERGFVFFDPLKQTSKLLKSIQSPRNPRSLSRGRKFSSSSSSSSYSFLPTAQAVSTACEPAIIMSRTNLVFLLDQQLTKLDNNNKEVYGRRKFEWDDLLEKKCANKNLKYPEDWEERRMLYEGFDAVVSFANLIDLFIRDYHVYKEKYSGSDHVFREWLTRNGSKYIKDHLLSTISFQGLSGHVTFFRDSRSGKVLVKQRQGNESVHVGMYRRGNLDLKRPLMLWPSVHPPPDISEDEPLCELQGIASLFRVSCMGAIVLLNVFIITPPIIFMLLYICYIKRSYEGRMKIMGDKLSIALREKWETKTQDITINRLLGQGEYAMVYGGDIRMPDGVCHAAAVKVLKKKASNDEKLMFFGEADMIKDFDHPNIIKLLGIVSIEDPGIVLMEYMINGDLRTYLLSRRHQATSPEAPESFSVRPQAITTMALEVAQALQYLFEHLCVHRDLACRNCLVSGTGTVKISDFGFAKKLVKGHSSLVINKVPIRWTAPECLEASMHTYQSDIWSYGVLVYEIFTFGNEPYQEMTNSEVMAWVLDGHTMPLPPSTSPQLASFVRQCWSFKSKDRVSIKTIISQLQSNPILLHPCLELPSSSSPPRSSRDLPHQSRRYSRQSSQLEEVITTLPSTSQQPLLSKPSTSSPNTPPPSTPGTSSFHQLNPRDARQALSATELRSEKGRGFLPLKLVPSTFRNLRRLRLKRDRRSKHHSTHAT